MQGSLRCCVRAKWVVLLCLGPLFSSRKLRLIHHDVDTVTAALYLKGRRTDM